MLFRLKIIATVLGGMLAFFGFQEFRVSRGTSVEPVAVELSTLEEGTAPPNNHIKIGDHVAIYAGSVYEYSQDKSDKGPPRPSSKVTHAYYPIISESHPYFDRLNDLSEKHGGEANIPDAEYPTIDDFTVLVKTMEFKTIGAIPDGLTLEESVQGLIVNQIDGLDKEEKKLVRESFPKTDVENVIMIQAGRKPASLGKSLGMLGGGSLLALIGIGSFFLGRS